MSGQTLRTKEGDKWGGVDGRVHNLAVGWRLLGGGLSMCEVHVGGKQAVLVLMHRKQTRAGEADFHREDVGDKPWAKDVIKKANMVANLFRNHRWPRWALRTELMAQKGVKVRVLLRPALTRFGTHFVMLDLLLTCKRALRCLVLALLGESWTNIDWQPYIRMNTYQVESLISDRAFWADLKKLHHDRVMKEHYNVLRMVDKDIHCLSRVYDAAVDVKSCVLHAPLTDDERDNILRDVGKRTDMLLSPVHAVARLLDPRLRDIIIFNNLDLMSQFDSVVDRLVAKNESQKFKNCKDQL
ncbi:hypothetical protein CBR_g40191 [Chara braunii]|uniref:Uncharacterized protein n=1 Tax=Chara braunii TaxID=69332 RepID=A0A388LTK9_CHABU|nr:hypothetical protein CBR_g40191 [Chara braunii]|eukprot:GBG85552.1 hypothetical protein CBR_g40191 [Chara braunii]